MGNDFNTKLKILLVLSLFVVPITGKLQVDKVLIYEIQTSGLTTKDEYIKLYNPSGVAISLDTWSIQYKSSTGDVFYKKNFPKESSIPSRGYFLIANTGYLGSEVADMTHSTFSLATTGGNLYLVRAKNKLTRKYDASVVVDRLAWGTGDDPEKNAAPAPGANEQITRKTDKDTDDNSVDFYISSDIAPEQTETKTEQDSEEGAQERETVNVPKPDETTQKTEEIKTDKPKTRGDIVITELLPNPYGKDSDGEWIEIKNIDTETIDLNGWTIGDDKKSYTIAPPSVPSTLLPPNQFLVLHRKTTNIALNNSGAETVTLKDSLGNTVDKISYEGTASEGASFAIDNKKAWSWTVAVTPNGENVIVAEKQKDDTENKTPTKTAKTKTPAKTIQNPPENTITNQEETPTRIFEEATTSTPLETYAQLIVNEILPNPDGGDEEGEWIELFNSGNTSIPLSGIVLGDDSTKTHTLKGGNIKPLSFLVIKRPESKIPLNNNGDTVKMWSPDGTLIASIKYLGSAKSGFSYALNDAGLWDWSGNPTPGSKNTFPKPQTTQQEQENSKPKTPDNMGRDNTPNETHSVPLEKVRQLKTGSLVTTQGTVAVPPNVFGKTYFYIVRDTHGIKIYSPKKNFPKMSIGDTVSVTGVLSESGNEKRIKTSTINKITTNDQGNAPKPTPIRIDEIGEPLEGSLVVIEGEIMSTKGSTVYIDDGSGEARVYLATNTNIPNGTMREGAFYKIIGIVSETKTGYRILPRSMEDIVKINKKGTVAGASTKNILIKSRKNTPTTPIYIFLGIAVLSAGFFLINKKLRQPKELRKTKTET